MNFKNNSLVKFKRALIHLLLFFSIAGMVGLTAIHTVFRPQYLELNLLINKYTDINIIQNYGIRRKILIAIKEITFLLPSNKSIQIQRELNRIGTTDVVEEKQKTSKKIYISNIEQFNLIINTAEPGTEIILKKGVYRIKGRRVVIKASGTPDKPIIFKAEKSGDVIFEMSSQEGFFISKPFIQFYNLVFKGVKGNDAWVEHAVHLVGDASNITFQNNQFINFNAHIKSNGIISKDGSRVFPNNIIINNNNFYNEWKRKTTSPVTPIDVVGGTNWLITNNFIADFAQNSQDGNGITYGAYLKGGSTNGVLDNNIVICSWRIPHTSFRDIRIGLSLGGGGTGNAFCQNGKCNFEHKNGTISNNTISNCDHDVGIYINKSSNTEIYNNILKNTLGIDIRFTESSADIYNNYIDGRIKSRDGGKISTNKNYKIIESH